MSFPVELDGGTAGVRAEGADLGEAGDPGGTILYHNKNDQSSQ